MNALTSAALPKTINLNVTEKNIADAAWECSKTNTFICMSCPLAMALKAFILSLDPISRAIVWTDGTGFTISLDGVETHYRHDGCSLEAMKLWDRKRQGTPGLFILHQG